MNLSTKLKNFKKEDKSFFINVLGAFLVKGLSLIVSIFSFPLYLRFFNNDIILGLWFTLLSILAWMLTFDFGIGNGLRNKLIGPLQRKDNQELREYVSSSYIVLAGISFIITIIGIPIIIFLDWNSIFGISKELVSIETFRLIIGINFLTIMLQFFLRIISSIIYSLQKSAINNLISLITSVIPLAFIIFLPRGNNVINLYSLSFIHMFSVISPLIIITVIIFKRDLKGFWPSTKFFNLKKAKDVFTNGAAIFTNQILFLLLTGTNNFIITRLFGSNYVVEYLKYYKIFSLFGTLYMLALTPLWSAVSKAKEIGDYKWIEKYFKLFNVGTIFVLFAQLLLFPLLQILFNVWLNEDTITVNYFYATIFSIFGTIFTVQTTVSTFAMGFNKTRLQAIFYSIAVLLKLVLLLIFYKLYSSWILIVIADCIVFIPYCLAEFFDLKKYIKSKIETAKQI